MPYTIRPVWLLTILTLCTDSRASEMEKEAFLSLDASVVSATRTQASIASIPGSIQVIDEYQIRQQAGTGRRLSDVLGQLVPSLSPSSGGMSNFGQTLRGRNMLVLIDGVSQNATRDNFRQLNSIAPNSIERIECCR